MSTAFCKIRSKIAAAVAITIEGKAMKILMKTPAGRSSLSANIMKITDCVFRPNVSTNPDHREHSFSGFGAPHRLMLEQLDSEQTSWPPLKQWEERTIDVNPEDLHAYHQRSPTLNGRGPEPAADRSQSRFEQRRGRQVSGGRAARQS